MSRSGGWVVALLVCASCSADGRLLVVELRTDLVPGVEMSFVVTNVVHGGRTDSVVHEVTRDAAYVDGVRTAEVELPVDGPVDVHVALLAPSGETLVSRPVRVEFAGARSVTIVVARDCRDLSCPGATDDPGATSCVGGACAVPECSSDRPDLCPPPECASDTQCTPSSACGRAVCAEGVCLDAPGDGCADGEFCNPDAAGCEMLPPPAACGLCGDVDGNGRTNITDSVALVNYSIGNPAIAPCADTHGDVLMDGTLSERDAVAILNAMFGVSSGTGLCEPCALECGDVDRDGALTMADATRVSEIDAGLVMPDVCEAWAADVDASRDIDVNDGLQIAQAVDGIEPLPGCVP